MGFMPPGVGYILKSGKWYSSHGYGISEGSVLYL